MSAGIKGWLADKLPVERGEESVPAIGRR